MDLKPREVRELTRILKYGGIIQAPFASRRRDLLTCERFTLFDDVIMDWYKKNSLREALMNLAIDPSGRQGLTTMLDILLDNRSIVIMSCRPEIFGRSDALRFTYHACEYIERMRENGLDERLLTSRFLKEVTDYPPEKTIFIDIDVTMPDIIKISSEARNFNCKVIA